MILKACGLIVEYNPFHHGHLYHIKEAKEKSNADCMIAVMSGPFLQRGEPALIDKFHRTRAALNSGVDIVLELPYAHAVQSSERFAEGAIKILHHVGADTVCFGSEAGRIDEFIFAASQFEKKEAAFKNNLKRYLNEGENYPTASAKAYQHINIKQFDLMQPNNILGFSYVRAIQKLKANIQPLTIKRIKSHYHDTEIENQIASATSIRKEILTNGYTKKAKVALPNKSFEEIQNYEATAKLLHHWDHYYDLLTYQIMAQSLSQLKQIDGIDEGLEYRLKSFIDKSASFEQFIQAIKSKRYTQTRLQRNMVHILTQTKQTDLLKWTSEAPLPYLRLLGMTEKGQDYINRTKKNIAVPIHTNLNKKNKKALYLDEKAQQIYYMALSPQQRIKLRQQEFQLPILI